WRWVARGGAIDRWCWPIIWRGRSPLRPGLPSPSFTAISAGNRPNASPTPTSWAAEAPKGAEARHEADERGKRWAGRPARLERRRGPMTDSFAEGHFEIVNNLGLHARAATKLVQLA